MKNQLKNFPFKRKSGILMPVSSLPSPYGIGTFGRGAYEFIDFLAETKQKCWQVLPLNPTSYGDSPYQSPASCAGNPYFIDPELLRDQGLLSSAELSVYKNNSYNQYDILLISLFEAIKPIDLSSFNGSSEPRHLLFDSKVRNLYKSGLSMHRISQILNTNHEVIRQIIIGTYDTPKHACSSYKCTKWDWDSIDQFCCDEFSNIIPKITPVTKASVAEAFNLKDKSLRNLPRLNAMIQSYKATSKH